MNARAAMSRPRLMERRTYATFVASFNLGNSICIDAHPAEYELTLDDEGGVMATLFAMRIGDQRCSRNMLVSMFGEVKVLANETHAEEWAADRKERFWE